MTVYVRVGDSAVNDDQVSDWEIIQLGLFGAGINNYAIHANYKNQGFSFFSDGEFNRVIEGLTKEQANSMLDDIIQQVAEKKLQGGGYVKIADPA